MYYLCGMKRIQYMMPVDWCRGALAVKEKLAYDGGAAYDLPNGMRISSDSYRPIIVAKVTGWEQVQKTKYFQVRSRSTVNMTAAFRKSLAVMGGAGALFAAILRDKEGEIYNACMIACPKLTRLRAWVLPQLMKGLSDKKPVILIGESIEVVNPWISSSTPNVPVSSAILDKFSDQLSNT